MFLSPGKMTWAKSCQLRLARFRKKKRPWLFLLSCGEAVNYQTIVKWTIKIGTIHVSTMRTCSSCETWSSCDQKKADVTTFREPVKPREACDPREHLVNFFYLFWYSTNDLRLDDWISSRPGGKGDSKIVGVYLEDNLLFFSHWPAYTIRKFKASSG